MKFKTNARVLAMAVSGAAALAPVAGAMPVFAQNVQTITDDKVVPSETDTNTVTVTNVEGAASVVAYRIYEPTYNQQGFVRFSNIDGVSLADAEHPKASEITTIARNIVNGAFTPDNAVTLTKNNSTYTGELGAGMWVIVVTDEDSAQYVYNPMVVSTYYTNANRANSLQSASLDSTSNFLESTDAGTIAVYAKRTTIPLDKTIRSADAVSADDDDGTENGAQSDDLGIGDTGEFEINTQIPAYSDAYKAKGVTYKIEDTQDDGLDAPTNLVVKVGDTEYTQGSASTFSITYKENDFEVDFNSDFALAHAGQDVRITYKAKLNENAKQKFDANNNTVKLTYTNDFTSKDHVDELTDDVSEYTFPVSVKKIPEIDGVSTNASSKGLPGADFTLTRINNSGNQAGYTKTITTDENGIAQFDRLDEGTYTIQETEAPDGYAINPKVYTLTVTPEYNKDGTLKQYTATLMDEDTSTVGSVTVNNADADILAGNITDTPLEVLPTTGGTGTVMFAVAGAGIMGAAVVITVYKKRKTA